MSRIGILSDTHDNLDRVRAAVAVFNKFEPATVVHCGDIVAQFVLKELVQLSVPLVAVFGNCDGDKESLRDRAREFNFTLEDGPYAFESGGKRVVVTHKPYAVPPDCDFYLHGHTHKNRHEGTRPAIVNPGECCGWLFGRSTIALLETDTGDVQFVDL
jgi:putative phosphoesterase